MITGNVRRFIGQNLRKLRQERGWTQQRLADLVGSDKSHVSAIERGHGLGGELLGRLCEAFGIAEEELTRPPSRQEGQGTLDMLPEVTRMILEELEKMPEYEQLRLLATMVERRIKSQEG